MSRRPVTAATKAVAALLSAAALSGCGVGLNPTTYQATGRMDGASANVGGLKGIAIRHLHVAPPAVGSLHEQTGTVLVLAGLSNGGTRDDALVGVESPAATAAAITVSGVEVATLPINAGKAAPSGFAIRLDGLTTSLHVGQSIPVTLVFASAGRITLDAPLLPGDNGLADREPAQDPNHLPE